MYFAIELPETEFKRIGLSTDAIKDALEESVTSLGFDEVRSKKLGVERDDWSKGDPCPDCGSREIHGLYTDSRELYSENGELEYTRETSWSQTYIRYQCYDCWLTLYANAPASLMK